jgi:predicted enzyme related to lactoylglutathione lyase
MTTTNTNSPSIKVVNWFDIPVTDIGKAAALYSAMLDRKLELSSFGGVAHALFPHGGENCVSGALVSDAKRPPRPGSGTIIYLAATDGIARCLARAVEAGAKVVQPETSIAPHGSIALIEDLDGNVIGLHEEPKA